MKFHPKYKMLPVLMFVSLCYTVLQTSCQRDAMLPSDYVQWIESEENGLKVSRLVNEATFTLQYQPHEYLIAKRLRGNPLTKALMREKIAPIKDMQYYVLRISVADAGTAMLKTGLLSDEQYYERVAYCTSAMQQDLKLVDGQDTLLCRLFHFERTYDLAPYSNFVLGFERPETTTHSKANNAKSNPTSNDKTLIFQDGLLYKGIIKMKIKGEAIKRIPTLKLQ